MPLAEIAAHMGPSAAVGQRSAMTYLATGVDLADVESLRAWDRSEIESAVLSTLREAVACQNAGIFTQNVALYTQDYFGRAGAAAYRPDGSDSQLATPQPSPADNRSGILDIGDFALLDDGRIGAVVITVAHTEPMEVTATYVIFAETGDRWLIDDAIPIDSRTGNPGVFVIPTSPIGHPSTPSSATVSAKARAVVEDYFAAATNTPTATILTEESPQTGAQPIFPAGTSVNVRGNSINLHTIPRTNSEIFARLGPCACAMEVFGPMVDSGDALWLPVTDLETGVSGYISFDVTLPPEHMSQAGFHIGQEIVATTPLRLRGVPEISRPADPAHPVGVRAWAAPHRTRLGQPSSRLRAKGSPGRPRIRASNCAQDAGRPPLPDPPLPDGWGRSDPASH